MVGIPAPLYFAVHRTMRPFIRLYRRFHPVPKSPEPSTPDEAVGLSLVPVERLTVSMVQSLSRLHSELKNNLGSYAEFGVYNGTSMICAFHAFRHIGISNPRLVGFDSFEGLPPEVIEDDNGVWRPGQFSCPLEITLRNLECVGATSNTVRLVKGWYKETLQAGTQTELLGPTSMVMIDSDAYSSAKLALEFVAPVLTNPAVIMFDDWKLNDLDIVGLGEYRAFREFLKRHPYFRARIYRGYNRKSKIVVIRRNKDASTLSQTR